MRMILRGSFRLALYVFFVMFPLLVASVFRPFWASDTMLVNFSIALGYMGFTIMALELVLVSRFETAVRAMGLDALQMFHKLMGIFALGLVLAHPLLLLGAGFPWRIFLPSSDVPWAIPLGTFALLALSLLIALSVWRKRLKISYETWQLSHSILAVAVLILAAVHILGVGRYAQTAPMQLLMGFYLLFLESLSS